MIDSLLLRFAQSFTEESLLRWTWVQAIAWSLADLLLVLAALRIAGLARAEAGRKPILLRYVLLAASAVLTPLLPLVRDTDEMFRLESAICGTQLAILLATALLDARAVLSLLLRRLPVDRQARPR